MPDKSLEILIRAKGDSSAIEKAAGALDDLTKATAKAGEKLDRTHESALDAIQTLLPGLSEYKEVLALLGNSGESAASAIGALVGKVVELAVGELRARLDEMSGPDATNARGGDVSVPTSGHRSGWPGDEDVPAPHVGRGALSEPPTPNQESQAAVRDEQIRSADAVGSDPGALGFDAAAATALSGAGKVDANQTQLLNALVSLLTNIHATQSEAIRIIADANKNAAAQQTLIEDVKRSVANLAMRIGQTNNVDHH